MGKVSGKTSVSLKDFLAARGELRNVCRVQAEPWGICMDSRKTPDFGREDEMRVLSV
jgi:hypothetical protein